MISFFRRTLRKSLSRCPQHTFRPQLESLDDRLVPSQSPVFVQTNLVSDVPGMAQNTDPLLVNPWGIAMSSGSPFWVSDNNSGFSTLYNGQGQPQALQVKIPLGPGDISPPLGSPTGTVFNTLGSGFDVTQNGKTGSSAFLFATEGGIIAGWSPSVNLKNAVIGATSPTADFTGLAIGVDAAGQTLLYAADHANGVIDVYDQNFKLVTTLAGSFTDPNLPKGAEPFNIQNINGQLFVEYTVSGKGNVQGAVDVFTTDGQPVNTHRPLIVGNQLDSPWGVTLAPSSFGQFGGALLVGNFGNGNINAFDPKNGHFLGTSPHFPTDSRSKKTTCGRCHSAMARHRPRTLCISRPGSTTKTMDYSVRFKPSQSYISPTQFSTTCPIPRSRQFRPSQPMATLTHTAQPSSLRTSREPVYSIQAISSFPISTAAAGYRGRVPRSSGSLQMGNNLSSSRADRGWD